MDKSMRSGGPPVKCSSYMAQYHGYGYTSASVSNNTSSLLLYSFISTECFHMRTSKQCSCEFLVLAWGCQCPKDQSSHIRSCSEVTQTCSLLSLKSTKFSCIHSVMTQQTLARYLFSVVVQWFSGSSTLNRQCLCLWYCKATMVRDN
jgi:hypothetical protein